MRKITTLKWIVVAVASLVSTQSFALGLGGELLYSNPEVKDYDGLNFDLVGVAGTLQLGEFDSLLAPAVHAQFSTGSGDTPNGKTDVNYFEVTGTGGVLIYDQNNIVVRGVAGIGIGIADIDVRASTIKNDTDASFVVFPVSVEASYLVPDTNLSFFANAGYKLYVDVADERIRCADGTVSSDTGYTVCNGKGGFAADSKFPVGKMQGVQLGFGVKLFY